MSAFARQRCYELVDNASDERITNFFVNNVAFQKFCIVNYIWQQSYLTHDKECRRVHPIQSQAELISTFETHFKHSDPLNTSYSSSSTTTTLPNPSQSVSISIAPKASITSATTSPTPTATATATPTPPRHAKNEEKEQKQEKQATPVPVPAMTMLDLDFDSLSHITQFLSYHDISSLGGSCSHFQTHISQCKTSELILHTQDGQPLPSIKDAVYLCRFGSLQSLIILGKDDSSWTNMPYGIKRFIDDINLYCTQLKELLIIDPLKHQKQWKPNFDRNNSLHFHNSYLGSPAFDSDDDSDQSSSAWSDLSIDDLDLFASHFDPVQSLQQSVSNAQQNVSGTSPNMGIIGNFGNIANSPSTPASAGMGLGAVGMGIKQTLMITSTFASDNENDDDVDDAQDAQDAVAPDANANANESSDDDDGSDTSDASDAAGNANNNNNNNNNNNANNNQNGGNRRHLFRMARDATDSAPLDDVDSLLRHFTRAAAGMDENAETAAIEEKNDQNDAVNERLGSLSRLSRFDRQDQIRRENAKFKLSKRRQTHVIKKEFGTGHHWFFMSGDPKLSRDTSKCQLLSALDTHDILSKYQTESTARSNNLVSEQQDQSSRRRRKKFIKTHFDSYSVVLEKLEFFKSLKRVVVTFYIPLSQIYTYLINLDQKQRMRLEEICILSDELYEAQTLKHKPQLRKEMKRKIRKYQCKHPRKAQLLLQGIDPVLAHKLRMRHKKNKNNNPNTPNTSNAPKIAQNGEKRKSSTKMVKMAKLSKNQNKNRYGRKLSKAARERLARDLFPSCLRVLYLPVFASMNWIVREPFLSTLERLVVNDINVDYAMYDCEWDISVISYLHAMCSPHALRSLYLTVNRYHSSRLDLSWALLHSDATATTIASNKNNSKISKNSKINKNLNKKKGDFGAEEGVDPMWIRTVLPVTPVTPVTPATPGGSNANAGNVGNGMSDGGDNQKRPSIGRRLSGLLSRLKSPKTESEGNNNNNVVNGVQREGSKDGKDEKEVNWSGDLLVFDVSRRLRRHLEKLFDMFEKYPNLEYVSIKCVKSQRSVNEKEISCNDVVAAVMAMKEVVEEKNVNVYMSLTQKNIIQVTRRLSN